jgi:GTP diphosphokinase / guanosine-3',5'-bis(diphosphate) 3'-diphosphatase
MAEAVGALDRAIQIAVEAHRGQLDKQGEPYILHPLRVMVQVVEDNERIAAALHDVVEDSEWTLDDLRREGFEEAVIEAVDALTRREGEAYLDYVDRAGANKIARMVKLADLRDNGDNPLRPVSGKLRERYEDAINWLLQDTYP